MADAKIVFDAWERAWLVKALDTLRTSLVRARAKEIPGSEIDVLRGKEIAQVEALRLKV